ncbi:hypothetical protein Tsubulata_038098 [Turnera subulata]|uniref:Uncharacterized protein n=1 Tax=Turnera subulata TaxID=218843 RepID=A0A9Q0FUZ6_9ROSI|nr:hypothetical protein Tsubulata_038098 [Turnera subulata]
MIVGDRIGKTIITGSKSAGGGSTTFNSAIVGSYEHGCQSFSSLQAPAKQSVDNGGEGGGGAVRCTVAVVESRKWE